MERGGESITDERNVEADEGQEDGEPTAATYDCSGGSRHHQGGDDGGDGHDDDDDDDGYGGYGGAAEAASAIIGRGVAAEWSRLSEDLLLRIFSLLPTIDRFRVCCVCRMWRHMSLSPNPGYWREANLYSLSSSKPHLTEQAVKAVVLRSKGMLVNLSIQCCQLSLLEYIGCNCPMLEGLIVGDVRFWSPNGPRGEWMPAVHAFVHGCGARLQSLKILFQVTEGDRRRRRELSAVVAALATGLPNLVSLVLHVTGQQRLQDDDVSVLTQHLPRLEVLKLTGAHITDASLDLIGTRLLSLRSLHVDGCRSLHQEAVDSLRSRRKNLHVSASGGFFWHPPTGVDDEDWAIMTVYAPVEYKEKIKFYAALPSWIPDVENLILAGDWNTVFNPGLDSPNPTPIREDTFVLTSLKGAQSLHDVKDLWDKVGSVWHSTEKVRSLMPRLRWVELNYERIKKAAVPTHWKRTLNKDQEQSSGFWVVDPENSSQLWKVLGPDPGPGTKVQIWRKKQDRNQTALIFEDEETVKTTVGLEEARVNKQVSHGSSVCQMVMVPHDRLIIEPLPFGWNQIPPAPPVLVYLYEAKIGVQILQDRVSRKPVTVATSRLTDLQSVGDGGFRLPQALQNTQKAAIPKTGVSAVASIIADNSLGYMA
ncbi:hypothetical protein CBR_g27971 [Chara braunii]|uniref:F-box domain-containing protein n=1 Tax=Chara braunii TaxID=69332 RepID=A0A388L8W8_CHABU|nr:hypothetical protein CBR_g27971 [Chara braunii]|eukprot:GBG78747.1 hypothetical protein CBR_g27971 [Chara braunii]